MHRTHQRRQQRVAYAASVRLHTSGRLHPFEARSINLSKSGVLVESLQPCAVGTEVICEIPLPGGRRRLRGRVARLQALSPAAVGLAIAFTELAEPDQDLLSEAIGQDESRSRVVQVRFEGMRDPMRSRAQLTKDGLRLSTALPFLRLRSPVEVTFLSGPSNVQSRGLVQQVELDQFAADGTPRLAVSVAFAADSDAEPVAALVAPVETTPTSPALPTMAAAPIHVPATPAPEPAPAPAATPERSQALVRILAVAAAVALVGLALSTYRDGSTTGDPAPVVGTTPAAAPPSSILAAPKTPPAAPTPTPPPGPAPAAAGLQVGQPVMVAAPAVPAPPPPVVVPIPPPLPPGTPGPTIETDGNETTAVVPVIGSTKGVLHYSLARRRGLVVNLPEASSALPLGLHAIGRDGLRYVWIRERSGGGIHVRFIFSKPPPDERLLELEDEAVKVRIRMAEPAVASGDTSDDSEASVVADTATP